jgi:hypothetical protein
MYQWCGNDGVPLMSATESAMRQKQCGNSATLAKAAKARSSELVQAQTEIQQLRARLRRTEKERDIFLNQAAAFFAGQLD